MSDSSRPHGLQPTRLLRPWDFPGKSTGVGCHCLLQCMKVKSESEVAQSCLTLRDPMDCSPPGSCLSMGFSRQEYWSGLPCPSPGDLPYPRIEPKSLRSPALAGRFFTTSTTWEALSWRWWSLKRGAHIIGRMQICAFGCGKKMLKLVFTLKLSFTNI